MKKNMILILSVLVLSTVWVADIIATELLDTLDKEFKSTGYPYEEKVVRMQVVTGINYMQGNQREHDILRSAKTHEKVVSVLKKHGWREDDPMLTDYLNGGKIEIVLEEGMNLKFKRTNRMFIYLHMCDQQRRKYRGQDLNEYLDKTIEDAEYCLTYENRLQGKNYPY